MSKSALRPVRATLIPLVLAGCAVSPYQAGPGLVENPDLLGPNITDEILQGEFFLGPGDQVDLKVFSETRYNHTAQLYSDGTAIFPEVGKVQLGGLTRLQVQERLQEAYARYLVDPRLDVTLDLSTRRKVTVLGMVANKGVYPLSDPGVTVLDMIARAGGINSEGDRTGVLIRRTVDGVPQVSHVNLDLVFQPGDPRIRTVIPYVHPGDVIYVVRAWEEGYNDFVDMVFRALRTLLVGERAIVGASRVDIAISGD